jgi:two-component system, LuxR family, response regulator FixJ
MVINKLSGIVYLVDDEFVMRDSLTLLIESTGLTVKSFESAYSFLSHYDPDKPACLILDVRMPTMTGLELQEELLKKAINIPIIFISGNAEIPDSAKAFRAGAIDFLEKPFDHNVLLMRIEEALMKDFEFRAKITETITLQQRINLLSLREKEVLSLVVNYHSNKEIGQLLNLSKRTIDVHRTHIMKKMQAENLAELVMMVKESHIAKNCLD